MSFVFEQPRSSIGDTFAGGEATIGDIYAAGYDQFIYGQNTNSGAAAMEEAFDDRIGEVYQATGVKIDNPMRALHSFPSVAAVRDFADPVGSFMGKVQEAASRIPDQSVINRLTRSIDGDAIRIAQESDTNAARLMASRPGIGKYLASFAAGMSASLRDPVQAPLLLLGGGPGAGRTVASRILSTAAKEAAINGASEAVLQPMVQAWRKKAGLDSGLADALGSIALAAAFGGVLGGGGAAIGEVGRKLSGQALEAAGDAAASDPRVAEPLRRAMAGDIAAARETLPEIREALPAEARGALDQAEMLEHLDATRPGSVSPEHHDATVSAAHRAIETDEAPAFQIDPEQVQRIVNDMIGDIPSPDAPDARSLAGFLIDAGGVQDLRGELGAIGATSVSEKFRGKLVRDGGMTLDQAREAAEEAGYIGRAGETQITTVADLLDALDEDLRGNLVFSREDQALLGRATDFEAQRAGLERTVAEIAHHAGPGIDDALIHQAAKLSIDEAIEPFDALESVLTRAEPEKRDGGPAPRGAGGTELPGWSDAELEAASAARGPEPEPGFFADPSHIDPELEIAPADIQQFGDMLLPGEDGRVMSLADYVDDINHGEDLAAIVKACKS